MDYPLLLHFCKPNSFGKAEYVLYAGDLSRVEPAAKDRRVRGWYLGYFDLRHGTRTAAVFGHEGRLYLDLGDGPFDIEGARIRIRRLLNFKRVQIRKADMQFTTWIRTPIWRYFTNDGQFPEQVEPFIEALDDLRNDERRDWMSRRLSEGIVFPDAV